MWPRWHSFRFYGQNYTLHTMRACGLNNPGLARYTNESMVTSRGADSARSVCRSSSRLLVDRIWEGVGT